MQRFTGTVEALGPVGITFMRDWIKAIPFTEWPMQGQGDNGVMVTDPEWHGFGEQAIPVVGQLRVHFPGCTFYQRWLSVVMPGHGISPHKDGQSHDWITRVHVPLITDEWAFFNVEDKPYWLIPGMAYMVNTMRTHWVENAGKTPRIHFMFDVRGHG